MVIVIPVPIILIQFFARKELNPVDPIEDIEKAKKRMQIKRSIGYSICFLVCAWCIWSIFMFSIEFGHNTSQTWLLNFGITTWLDIIFKDVLVAIIMVLIVLYLPIIKYKCKNRKNKYKVHSAIQNLAGDVVSVMNEKKGNIVFRRKSAILDNGMVVRAIMRTRTLCYI